MGTSYSMMSVCSKQVMSFINELKMFVHKLSMTPNKSPYFHIRNIIFLYNVSIHGITDDIITEYIKLHNLTDIHHFAINLFLYKIHNYEWKNKSHLTFYSKMVKYLEYINDKFIEPHPIIQKTVETPIVIKVRSNSTPDLSFYKKQNILTPRRKSIRKMKTCVY